jgi:hypothetical protein
MLFATTHLILLLFDKMKMPFFLQTFAEKKIEGRTKKKLPG